MGRLLVESVAPGSWDDAYLESNGTTESTGDLSRLIGTAENQVQYLYRSTGPGEAAVEESPVTYPDGEPVEGLVARRYISDDAPIAGEVLTLHNSFGWAFIPTVAAYYNDVTFINRTIPDLSYLETHLATADSVSLLLVQRSAYEQIVDLGLAEGFAAAYRHELPAAPIEIADGAVTIDTSPNIDVYLIAEINDPDTPRDIQVGSTKTRLSRNQPFVAFLLDQATVEVGPTDGFSFSAVAVVRSSSE